MNERNPPATAGPWSRRELLFISPFPLDRFGEAEARRTYFLGKRLQERGARVHVLHCPLDAPALTSEQLKAHRSMAAEWDGFYFIPPTLARSDPTLSGASEKYWNPAVGAMLEWLLARRTFDAVVLNSPWLRKAFTFLPKTALKILDVRDGFLDLALEDLDKRELFADADVIWTRPWRVGAYQELTRATVNSVGHAEPFAPRLLGAQGGSTRFGLIVGPSDVEVAAADLFLQSLSARLTDVLSPVEIRVGGRGAERLRLEIYPDAKSLDATGERGVFDAFDVAILLSAATLGTEANALECLRHGKPIVSLGECWEEWRPTHRYHQLASFDEVVAACEAIMTNPNLVDMLQDASFEAMADALRIADRSLDAAAPAVGRRAARARISESVVFVLDAGEIWNGSLALDHVCEAARFVGLQTKVSFFVGGRARGWEERALTRLLSLGALALAPETARAFSSASLECWNAEVATFQALAEARQHGFWFASRVDELPSAWDRIPATAFAPLSLLATSGAEKDVFAFVLQLSVKFGHMVAMDERVTRLISAMWSKGLAARIVPAFWHGDNSQLRHVAESRSGEAVALFSGDSADPLTRLAVETALQNTRRPVELVYDEREKPLTHGFSYSRLRVIPHSQYLRHLADEGRAPWLCVDLGRESAHGALLDALERSGTPRITLFAPGVPRPIVSAKRRRFINGVMESALALRDILAEEGLAADCVDRDRGYGDTADDAGWTLIWDEVGRSIERVALEASYTIAEPRALRSVRAEMIVNVQGQGAFRFSSPGWTETRAPIEAFAVRPLERVAAGSVEYMAIGSQGRQTPWVSDSKLCGSRGEGLALTGFAVRPAPEMLHEIEIVYEGVFRKAGSVGPSRNGELCASSHEGDPLLAINVALFQFN